MPKPPSPHRWPLARHLVALQSDTTMEPGLRRHLVAVCRLVVAQIGQNVTAQMVLVGVLAQYRAILEKPPDGLTAARVTSEMVRALRSLGLLRAAVWNGGSLVVPRTRRRRVPALVMPAPGDADDDDGAGPQGLNGRHSDDDQEQDTTADEAETDAEVSQ